MQQPSQQLRETAILMTVHSDVQLATKECICSHHLEWLKTSETSAGCTLLLFGKEWLKTSETSAGCMLLLFGKDLTFISQNGLFLLIYHHLFIVL